MPSLARLATAVEERLLVPTYAWRWPQAPIAAHRGLALPLQLRGTVRRLQSDTEAGPVRITAAGREKLLAPFLQRLFDRSTVLSVEPGRGLWRTHAPDSFEADLVLMEVHRWLAPRFRREGWTIVPAAVRWAGALADVPGPSPCHSVREDRRKVRSAGFTMEQAESASAWELFGARMVAPQALARFGDDAWPRCWPSSVAPAHCTWFCSTAARWPGSARCGGEIRCGFRSRACSTVTPSSSAAVRASPR